MITLRIDITPQGWKKSRCYAEVEIENDGTGTETRGNYIVRWKCPELAKEGAFTLRDYRREAVLALCSQALSCIAFEAYN